MRRLDQILANLGYCSRREARLWIESGRVTVAGKTPTDPGMKSEHADVLVDGQPLDHPEGLLLVFNKPAGLVCSHDTKEGPNVYSVLPERWHRRNPQVTSVGRLDKETTGLLLLTDQSVFVHRLTSPKHKVSKLYQVTTAQDMPPGLVELFASGTLLLSGESDPCLPAELRIKTKRTADLILVEGRYHQVRRMFANQGCEVTALHRTTFGNLELGDLPIGQCRELPLNFFD